MQLFIVRHGESANNALEIGDMGYEDYMAQRSPDPGLTQIGKRQAQLVAAHLATNSHPESNESPAPMSTRGGYGITELYCSAMVRAMQTAQPIGQAIGLPPRIWVDIHEHGGLFLGNPRQPDSIRSFRGLTRAEIGEQFPGYVIPDEIAESGWWTGGYEETEQCEDRAARVAAALRERAKTDHDSVVALVSHGTFVDRLLKALLRQEGQREFFFFHYNSAITRVDFTQDGPLVMRYINRTQHLPAQLITK